MQLNVPGTINSKPPQNFHGMNTEAEEAATVYEAFEGNILHQYKSDHNVTNHASRHLISICAHST